MLSCTFKRFCEIITPVVHGFSPEQALIAEHRQGLAVALNRPRTRACRLSYNLLTPDLRFPIKSFFADAVDDGLFTRCRRILFLTLWRSRLRWREYGEREGRGKMQCKRSAGHRSCRIIFSFHVVIESASSEFRAASKVMALQDGGIAAVALLTHEEHKNVVNRIQLSSRNQTRVKVLPSSCIPVFQKVITAARFNFDVEVNATCTDAGKSGPLIYPWSTFVPVVRSALIHGSDIGAMT